MNIHDIVRISRVTDAVLAEKTTLQPLERMELLIELQSALINDVVSDEARPPLNAPAVHTVELNPPQYPECSICRRRHGANITHASE